MKKLVVDLGHGGRDPGAVGPNKTHEADVVLVIGLPITESKKVTKHWPKYWNY